MTTYYKTFRTGRIGPHSGKKWPARIGAWVSVDCPLEVCSNGIHVARGEAELLRWLDVEVYEVEIRGERIDSDEKACVRECRLVRRVESLNDRTLRLFAADCAERALSLVENPDPRSVEAVRVARLFAEDEATRNELAAAGAAAGAAAWDAGAAAWAAARAAAWDAGAAAWDAGDAARDAAWAAARAAAWDAGDAARAAAWAAARAAAWDAGAAARAAAWDAGAAAGDAEREWQAQRLRYYINGEQEDA